jgi:hypothetical protein
MVAEVVGGVVANSLALLADAGHMLSDVGALGLSLFALWMAARPSGPRKTFGYHRIEILAALVNGATLVALAVWIVVEAVARLEEPPEVRGPLLLAVAIGGLVVNLIALPFRRVPLRLFRPLCAPPRLPSTNADSPPDIGPLQRGLRRSTRRTATPWEWSGATRPARTKPPPNARSRRGKCSRRPPSIRTRQRATSVTGRVGSTAS